MDNAANVVQQFSFGKPNASSITFFLIVIALTLYVTFWASKKSQKTVGAYYTAGGGITGFQNGLALGGDYMSAASFLGISGMVALKGYDGIIYAVGWLVGWPALLFLIAEPLRNLGKYSFADVVAFRLNQKPIKTAAAIGGLIVLFSYTTAQMVGAGSLIKLLFGLPYEMAVVIVGVVMLIYLLVGGMLATTWVQIIKAVLLLGGTTIIFFLVLVKFNFNPTDLWAAAADKYGQKTLEPGGMVTNAADAISLGLALMLGLLGLPHILMRFFTVPNAKEARKSIVWATTWIGYFYLVIPFVGFGAAVLVTRETITGIDKGGNMAAPMLAEVLGGAPLMGFIAAVAFATILAVVAGLTLAASAAMANDLWIGVVKGGKATEAEKYKSAKVATVIWGILAIFFGIAFKGQNVAFMVGLAFAVAASANFPALFLSIVWKKFTTAGAVWSILIGGIVSLVLIIIGPTVWVDVLKNKEAIFPYKFPTIFTLPLAFIVGWIASIMSPDPKAQELFEDEKLRTYLGVGASGASDH